MTNNREKKLMQATGFQQTRKGGGGKKYEDFKTVIQKKTRGRGKESNQSMRKSEKEKQSCKIESRRMRWEAGILGNNETVQKFGNVTKDTSKQVKLGGKRY